MFISMRGLQVILHASVRQNTDTRTPTCGGRTAGQQYTSVTHNRDMKLASAATPCDWGE